PALRTKLEALPRSGQVAMVWNPQSEGSPNVKGNMPRAYYPGTSFVDYVANDMYSIKGHAAWRQQEAFYRDFSTKPFMVAEWAPWGTDEPAFIKAMFNWTASHARVAAVIYFNGTRRGLFTLSAKPKSMAAYRQMVNARRYDCPTGCGTMPS
ncbi:MAG: hypothetical protein H7123_00705, partial [Thermoleophilia bacterium]|nr:hypothetical protein [Thermoleophilia bacterium]